VCGVCISIYVRTSDYVVYVNVFVSDVCTNIRARTSDFSVCVDVFISSMCTRICVPKYT